MLWFHLAIKNKQEDHCSQTSYDECTIVWLWIGTTAFSDYGRHDINKSIDLSQLHVHRHVAQLFSQGDTGCGNAFPVQGITFLNNYVFAAIVGSRLGPLNVRLRLSPSSWKRKLTADSDCGPCCVKTRQGSRAKKNTTVTFNKLQLQKCRIDGASGPNASPLYN